MFFLLDRLLFLFDGLDSGPLFVLGSGWGTGGHRDGGCNIKAEGGSEVDGTGGGNGCSRGKRQDGDGDLS